MKKLASGTAYSYKLTFADGTVNTSADPYATAAVANGERSVVLSKKAMGKAGKRMPAFGKTTDATIAEMNIRDFSINPASGISADKQGKYLGVVESGTKTAKEGATSGLDYLKSAGHQPCADHADVRLRFRQRDRRPELQRRMARRTGATTRRTTTCRKARTPPIRATRAPASPK